MGPLKTTFSLAAIATTALSAVAYNVTVYASGTGVCTHGEFRCTPTSTDRCNWGQWHVNPCPQGTTCVPYGDWECVQNDRLEQVIAQLTGGVQSKCDMHALKGATIDASAPCSEHGKYQCLGRDLGICNFGKWAVTKAHEGTACVPFDYEFIPDRDWDTVFRLVAPQCF